MKGDFTRNTFDPRKHFSRVLMQQGRVQLDADWNEQAAILLHYLQTLAEDLIGPYAGPRDRLGFEIGGADQEIEDFAIGNGRYYVQGVLCENEPQWDAKGALIPVTFATQPDYPVPPELPALPFLVYLDVWERHLTYLEAPMIREVALGGSDTSTRAKIVWQVKVWEQTGACPNPDEWASLVEQWQPRNRGRLRAGVKEFEAESTEPCNISPESKYRGAENQLYRVEIHQGGAAGDTTFKWSRENGSVVFPILKVTTDSSAKTTTVYLEHLGRDDRFSLQEGDWVELVDDAIALHGIAESLLRVSYVDRETQLVRLEGLPDSVWQTPRLHPLLRRWDHQERPTTAGYPALAEDGALTLEEGNWLLLEDGIQVYFEKSPNNAPARYRTGDYWLIPARTATGDVEWPGEPDAPESVPPLGVWHRYAPLAVVAMNAAGGAVVVTDCRCVIDPLWECEEG